MPYNILVAAIYLIFSEIVVTSSELNAVLFLSCLFLIILRIYFINSGRTSHPFFLRFFIVTPANNRNFFWKEGIMINYLFNKKNFLFYYRNITNSYQNLVGTSRLNPYPILLWRPLIKRWSYFGLYVHSRAGFLKFFKNQNVK